MKTIFRTVAGLSLAGCGAFLCAAQGDREPAARVFELRTYYAAPGKMEALHARFRDNTCKLFEKHGMTIVGFWSPIDAEQAKHKLIYLLSFPSQEAAAKSWKEFRADAQWKAVKDTSERNGKLVEKIESVYLRATDYSRLTGRVE